MTAVDRCPGPLVWFHIGDPPDSGLLECNSCDYVIVTGNFNDELHADTPVLVSAQ